YIEINNFYTSTVYEKGAEVIRMLRILIGEEGYRKGLDLYFDRHDGEACTIEQFRACFEEACGTDLSHFARWWSQAGTPVVTVREEWQDSQYTLTLSQVTPPSPGQAEKAPQVIPCQFGLLGADGRELVPTRLLELTGAEETAIFVGLGERPTASLFRGFSAPVVVSRELSEADLALLLGHDSDPFNRWEAGRQYAQRIVFDLLAGSEDVPEAWSAACGALLTDPSLDPAFRALALDLPGEDELAGEIAANGGHADPDAIHAALTRLRRHLAASLEKELVETYHAMDVPGSYSPDADSAGKRALRGRCLSLLMAGPKGAALAAERFSQADNMTDQMAGLIALVHHGAEGWEEALSAFHRQWQGDALVLDKWFSLQAVNPRAGAVARVMALTDHGDFDWRTPNRFRSVIAAFAMGNPTGFHTASGAGYALLGDWLIKLDSVNPQTAARVAGCFETWRRYNPERQQKMQDQIARILAVDGLSRNTTEILSRIAEA
ncbi:MAG: DUF3458 domain-containing protein, partial [Pseudomonadota bacterium]